MFRRATIVLSIAAVLLVAGAQVALAWSNGPHNDSTNYQTTNGVGFGTHDWILSHAADIAGDGASWLDIDEAMRASQLPDYPNRTSGFLHTFRPTGRSQGAPQKSADLYHLAALAYQRGDTEKASYYIGVMSHYYTDALVPFHTNTYSSKNDDLHKTYERLVETEINRASDRPGWSVPRDSVEPVTDIRKKAVSAAVYSRSKAHVLLPALKERASIHNSTVDRVTQECLSRGVNDMADIISSIPSGEGTAAAPAAISKRITRRSVTLGSKVGLYTRCLDENGKPIRGARVVFAWPTKTGTFKMVRYSDADGWVHDYYAIKGLATGRKTRVRAYSESSGQTTTVSEWFVPRR